MEKQTTGSGPIISMGCIHWERDSGTPREVSNKGPPQMWTPALTDSGNCYKNPKRGVCHAPYSKMFMVQPWTTQAEKTIRVFDSGINSGLFGVGGFQPDRIFFFALLSPRLFRRAKEAPGAWSNNVKGWFLGSVWVVLKREPSKLVAFLLFPFQA